MLRSAQCLSLAGLNEEAAHYFFFFNLGQKTMAAMYLKARKLDLALPLLQSVSPAHRSFSACRLLAGKTLLQKGQSDLAVSMLAPLRDCSLFNRLGNEDLRRIWMAGKTGECRPGKVILKAGEVAPGLMVVLAGGITITPDPANPDLSSGFLGPGDYVGLGSLLNGPPQPNALVAQQGTRLLVLPLEPLDALLSAEPEVGLRFYRSVAEHLVQTLLAGAARTPET